MACGVWSFRHEVEKMYGEHVRRRSGRAAFEVIRKVLSRRRTSSRPAMFDQI
jgi:hypothetical protein